MRSDSSMIAMRGPLTLGPDDLFAALDQAFRRHKACRACSFSLPELVKPASPGAANWTVFPSASCSDECRDVLDQLIARFQSAYRLKAT